MPSLADINQQKRTFAFSGRAGVDDVPYLYALQEAQAGNAPAGIGQQQAGALGNDGGAPNPQAAGFGGGGFGGGGGGGVGSSGAADVGLPGPGLDGYENRLYDLFNAYERGGGAGEPGGLDRGFNPEATDYTNLSGLPGTLLDIAGYVPGPIGTFANFAAAGIRGANASLLDRQLEEAGFSSGLGFGQQLGATLGLNSYGGGSAASNLAGSAAAQRDALTGGQSFNSLSGAGGTYRASPSGPVARDPNRGSGGRAERGGGGLGDPSGGVSRDVDRGFSGGGYGI